MDLGGSAGLQTEKKVASDGTINLTIRRTVVSSGQTPDLSKEGFEQVTGAYSRKARRPLSATSDRIAAVRMEQANAVQSGPLLTGTAIKISVSEDGIYYIDSADISTMLSIPQFKVKELIRSGRFSLTSGDMQVAYTPAEHYIGLFFYGNAVDSLFTDKNIYWLKKGSGTLMQSVDGGIRYANGKDLPESFTETLHFERGVFSAPGLIFDPDTDYWFWDYVMAGYPPFDNREFSFQVNSISAADDTASIVVRLQSITTEPSRVLLSLNGETLKEGVWEGLNPYTIVAEVRSGLLKEGEENLLGVKALPEPDVSFSMFLIDSFDVTYARRFEAINDVLGFRSEENSVLGIEGFTNPDISVFDITNRLRPRLVTSTRPP